MIKTFNEFTKVNEGVRRTQTSLDMKHPNYGRMYIDNAGGGIMFNIQSNVGDGQFKIEDPQDLRDLRDLLNMWVK